MTQGSAHSVDGQTFGEGQAPKDMECRFFAKLRIEMFIKAARILLLQMRRSKLQGLLSDDSTQASFHTFWDE